MLDSATLYVAATDDSGAVWGGAPCVACLLEVIQAGVTGIVSLPFKTVPSRWRDDIEESRRLIAEVGIHYKEVEIPPDLSKGSFY
jgi:deoxycytidylate deaminase